MILSCGFKSAVYTWKLAGEPDRGCTFTVAIENWSRAKKILVKGQWSETKLNIEKYI